MHEIAGRAINSATELTANTTKLVKAAKRGDKEAFVGLLKPLEARLFQTALAIVGSRQDAEDVWQNTVLLAWSHINKLRQPRYFKTWITRILLNEAKSCLRRRTDTPMPNEELLEAGVFAADIENKLLVRSYLDMLPLEQREAILLRYWLDLPLKEIAKVMGVPLSTAKTRLYQGMRSLQSIMEEDSQ